MAWPRRTCARVLDVARGTDTFVRVDMEASAYTARTLEVIDHVRAAGYENVGPVIQAYLYRSSGDVERLIREGVRVRLCKGAYNEAPNVAFRRKRDTDRNYVRLMETLLQHGNYPAIATHDEAIIAHARAFVAANGIGRERFEFQMLYGVRRDLQDMLVAEGYNVRVYVPVRLAVVSLPGAPPGRAPGQPGVRAGEHGPRRRDPVGAVSLTYTV